MGSWCSGSRKTPELFVFRVVKLFQAVVVGASSYNVNHFNSNKVKYKKIRKKNIFFHLKKGEKIKLRLLVEKTVNENWLNAVGI